MKEHKKGVNRDRTNINRPIKANTNNLGNE